MILSFVAAFILTAVLIPLVRRAAITQGFLDAPGGRKRHQDLIPPIGGLVIVPVFIFLSIVFSPELVATYGAFYAALVMIWLMGAVDDEYTINATTKFVVQFAVAITVVFFDYARVLYLGPLLGFGQIWLGPFALPFSVLCVVLLINAINMIDGLDGLCAGLVLVMLGWVLVAAIGEGGHILVLPIAICCGTLLGFLMYNYRYPGHPKASVFLGDSGSTSLGLILAWLVIHLTQKPLELQPGLIEPVLIAWILALPVFDALSLFTYRIMQKRHPFSPDRRHLHYLLHDSGYSVGRTVTIIHGITFLYGGFGAVGYMVGIPVVMLFIPWVILFALHGLIIFGRLFNTRSR